MLECETLLDAALIDRDDGRGFLHAAGAKLPDDEATTVAGLVIHEAQMIPDVGQAFTFYGHTFEVLRRRRNQVTSIRISPARNKPAVREA